MLLGYGAKVGLGNMRVKAENRMVTMFQMFTDVFLVVMFETAETTGVKQN